MCSLEFFVILYFNRDCSYVQYGGFWCATLIENCSYMKPLCLVCSTEVFGTRRLTNLFVLCAVRRFLVRGGWAHLSRVPGAGGDRVLWGEEVPKGQQTLRHVSVAKKKHYFFSTRFFKLKNKGFLFKKPFFLCFFHIDELYEQQTLCHVSSVAKTTFFFVQTCFF